MISWSWSVDNNTEVKYNVDMFNLERASFYLNARSCGWSQSRMAEHLGISKQAVSKQIINYKAKGVLK